MRNEDDDGARFCTMMLSAEDLDYKIREGDDWEYDDDDPASGGDDDTPGNNDSNGETDEDENNEDEDDNNEGEGDSDEDEDDEDNDNRVNRGIQDYGEPEGYEPGFIDTSRNRIVYSSTKRAPNVDNDENGNDAENDGGGGDGGVGDGGGVLRAVFVKTSIWPLKKDKYLNVSVSFIGGSTYQHNLVKTYAVQWQNGTAVRFNFNPRGRAQIRVAFANDGNWSFIGTDALNVSGPTMNLENVDEGTILHEFGHALGMAHEHSSPVASIPWDVNKVYDYYRRTQGWDKAKTKFNVLDFYRKSQTNFSKFDRSSIMLYDIPSFLLLPDANGKPRPSFVGGKALSPTDKRWMAKTYPPPKTRPPPPPPPPPDRWARYNRRLQNITTGNWNIYPEAIRNTYNGEILWTDGLANLAFASAPNIQAYQVVRRSPNAENGQVVAVGLASASPYYFKLLD